ncbi:thymidine kinase, cytosolic-like [Symsagittifera roscoffensis]|uniref:thymidine kinase, cytosolic-like n=1 Tax=Symsagittifera roscoffensis TaxID=84072 RepID=UPI00307B9D1B
MAATKGVHLEVLILMNNQLLRIDEGQFFDDIVSFCEKSANAGKTVIVAALDGDFLRHGFNDILNLVPLAESVIKLNSVCMLCYGDASFTKRIGTEMTLEVIGGSDKYIAACRSCHSKQLLSPLTPSVMINGNHTQLRDCVLLNKAELVKTSSEDKENIRKTESNNLS